MADAVIVGGANGAGKTTFARQILPTLLNSARKVFPYMVTGSVPDYFASRFFIASKEPLLLDAEILRQRFAGVDLEASFNESQGKRLEEFVAGMPLRRLKQRGRVERLPEERFNRDLHPRDEYFLNNGW